IKVVVPPYKASVQRPTFPGFLPIDFCVVVRVSAFENFLATAEDRKAVHHLRIFSRSHVLVELEKDLLIQPNTGRAGRCPTLGGPKGFIPWPSRCLSTE